jgi:hypothetical protein
MIEIQEILETLRGEKFWSILCLVLSVLFLLKTIHSIIRREFAGWRYRRIEPHLDRAFEMAGRKRTADEEIEFQEIYQEVKRIGAIVSWILLITGIHFEG